MSYAKGDVLKIVILGATSREVGSFIRELSEYFNSAEVDVGLVAGLEIFRFKSSYQSRDHQKHSFQVFAASLEADFRGIYARLFQGAVGGFCLIPADQNRIVEGRQLLGLLQSSFLSRDFEGLEPQFFLQYQWLSELQEPSPEVLDQALGVNSQSVTRICSTIGHSNQVTGLNQLLASLTEINDAPTR